MGLIIYRALERVKSAIVDGIRYAGELRRPERRAAERHA